MLKFDAVVVLFVVVAEFVVASEETYLERDSTENRTLIFLAFLFCQHTKVQFTRNPAVVN